MIGKIRTMNIGSPTAKPFNVHCSFVVFCPFVVALCSPIGIFTLLNVKSLLAYISPFFGQSVRLVGNAREPLKIGRLIK